MSVAIDNAPAMIGRYRGFILYFKMSVLNVFAMHCVIHRQHLAAKNLSKHLHRSLQYVIIAVNKIRSNALNDRLFEQLGIENDEDFNRLLFHTEVHWLSKGACLNRFYDLFVSIIELFKNKNDSLQENLVKFKNDIVYLTDLYNMFNETNLQL